MASDGGVAPMQPRELSEYACWRHPFRESHIYMHPAQPHRVRAQILDSSSRRILRKLVVCCWAAFLERAGMSIVIEDVEFVAGSGKYFNSSPADLAKLASSLNGPPKRVDLTYIGYFRSHIREGLFLSAEDGEFAEGRLRHPDAIFLVVKPYDSGICMAGFFCWQNGVLEKEFSPLEAPFGLPEKRKTDPAEPSDLILRQPDASNSFGTREHGSGGTNGCIRVENRARPRRSGVWEQSRQTGPHRIFRRLGGRAARLQNRQWRRPRNLRSRFRRRTRGSGEDRFTGRRPCMCRCDRRLYKPFASAEASSNSA